MAGIPSYTAPAPEQWTREEESRFLAMSERRKRVMEARRAPVNILARSILRMKTEVSEECLTDMLINNADEIRDILEPFDSGVRPAKGD